METACELREDIVMHPFAFRTHAHTHGKLNRCNIMVVFHCYIWIHIYGNLTGYCWWFRWSDCRLSYQRREMDRNRQNESPQTTGRATSASISYHSDLCHKLITAVLTEQSFSCFVMEGGGRVSWYRQDRDIYVPGRCNIHVVLARNIRVKGRTAIAYY